jgi:hypothetical protein
MKKSFSHRRMIVWEFPARQKACQAGMWHKNKLKTDEKYQVTAFNIIYFNTNPRTARRIDIEEKTSE